MIKKKSCHLLNTLYAPDIMGSANSPLFHFRLKTILGHEFHCFHFIDVETEVCVVK